ncbi:MAG: pyridoxal phosphate-dependent aminotransferase [Pseudomonadales bacterium]|nr:pyridoxal phosphate-dependent aminotransferase [Pseudomonadales bacterium]
MSHNLSASRVRLQPVSVTRKMAASLPGLRARALERGLKIHHLGAGYPHPEVTDPTSFIQKTESWFQHLRLTEGVNDPDGTPDFLREAYAYTDTLGPIGPRESFASVYGHDWGIEIDPNRLIPTVGATGGIALMCSTFERTGESVAYLTDAPTYAGFLARASLAHHASIYSIEMDAHGPLPTVFRNQIHRARNDGNFVPFYYTVPDGHNPAGFSFSVERRQEILDIACEEGILIVEDAPYVYISFADPSARPKPFVSMDPKQSVHLFTGSKIGLPGPRIGFAYSEATIQIADQEEIGLTDLLLTESSADILFQNPQALRAFQSLLHEDNGDLSKSLWPVANKKLEIYAENRGIVLDGLQEHLGKYHDYFSWTIPEAGFFTVFTFKKGGIRTDDAFIEWLVSEHGVVVVPMYDFYPPDARIRNPGAGYDQLRLSFCFTESEGEQRRQDLREALAAFSAAVKAAVGLL